MCKNILQLAKDIGALVFIRTRANYSVRGDVNDFKLAIQKARGEAHEVLIHAL